jgi:hypothetical protein
MSQPVKLSDALALDARITGELVERSIAGQVEFWARLGRSIEPLIDGDHVLALCRNAATRPLSECVASLDSEQGRQRLDSYLEHQPFPHKNETRSRNAFSHGFIRDIPGLTCLPGMTS